MQAVAEDKEFKTGTGRRRGSSNKRSRELSDRLERMDADPAMALAKLMRFTRPFYPPLCDFSGCPDFATRGGIKRPDKKWCSEHSPDDAPEIKMPKNPNMDLVVHKECAIALQPYAYARLHTVEMDVAATMGNIHINIIPSFPSNETKVIGSSELKLLDSGSTEEDQDDY